MLYNSTITFDLLIVSIHLLSDTYLLYDKFKKVAQDNEISYNLNSKTGETFETNLSGTCVISIVMCEINKLCCKLGLGVGGGGGGGGSNPVGDSLNTPAVGTFQST